MKKLLKITALSTLLFTSSIFADVITQSTPIPPPILLNQLPTDTTYFSIDGIIQREDLWSPLQPES